MPVVFAFESRVYRWRPEAVQRMIHAEPLFRRVIERCDDTVRDLLGWSIVEELARPPDTARFNSTEELLEPILAAVSIAQVELWRQRGLEPDAVIGLSGGEFTAAYAAGALTLEDTLRLTCHWSRLLQADRIAVGGQVMVTVGWEQASSLPAALDLEVYPSVEWSPTATMFSGRTPAIDALITHLDAAAIGYRRQDSRFAYHTALSEGAADDFAAALRWLRPQPSRLPLYAASAGGLTHDARFDARHWWQMLSGPALVFRAFRQLVHDGHDRVLAIGLRDAAMFPLAQMVALFDRPLEIASSLACLVENQKPFEPQGNRAVGRSTQRRSLT